MTIHRNNVEVYWNLHKHIFSVRNKGIVIEHAHTIVLQNVKFVVQLAGRAKVLLEQKKNVHAFVKGEVNNEFSLDYLQPFQRAVYNPYKADTFVSCSTGDAIYEADMAFLVCPNDTPMIYYRKDGEI